MKLQVKLLIPVVSLILLLTVLLSLVYGYLLGGMALTQFYKRGMSVAASLASSGRLGVLMRDSTQLGSVMEAVMADGEIRYACFFDDQGAQVACRGEAPRSETTDAAKTAQSVHRLITAAGESIEEFHAPVFTKGIGSTIVGTAAVGITKEPLIAERTSTTLWSIGLCFLFAFSAVAAVVLIMKIIRPLVQGIALVSSGDLTVELDSRSNDEVGTLVHALGSFIADLRGSVRAVQQATVQVAEHTQQILSDATAMAGGTEEQSQRVAEVAGAVEEMTKTIVENSRNAGDTAATAKEAKHAAEEGGRVVSETVEGMKRIAGVVKKSAETVERLGKSSDQIGEIISVIDDIADQTNLLALNAAIEAARAGEQGRGFAVVADEVRKLAERTTKATKEIATMIKTIQQDTAGAVTSMHEGTDEVSRGITLTDSAGNALREIVAISQKVTDKIMQIAAASGQQSAAAEQITKNVEAISQVTGRTADGTHMIATATEHLHTLTGQLQDLVGKFKLQRLDDTRTASSPPATSRPVPGRRKPANGRMHVQEHS